MWQLQRTPKGQNGPKGPPKAWSSLTSNEKSHFKVKIETEFGIFKCWAFLPLLLKLDEHQMQNRSNVETHFFRSILLNLLMQSNFYPISTQVYCFNTYLSEYGKTWPTYLEVPQIGIQEYSVFESSLFLLLLLLVSTPFLKMVFPWLFHFHKM